MHNKSMVKMKHINEKLKKYLHILTPTNCTVIHPEDIGKSYTK